MDIRAPNADVDGKGPHMPEFRFGGKGKGDVELDTKAKAPSVKGDIDIDKPKL